MTAHTSPALFVCLASHSVHLAGLLALAPGVPTVWAALRTGIARHGTMCQWMDVTRIAPSAEDLHLSLETYSDVSALLELCEVGGSYAL